MPATAPLQVLIVRHPKDTDVMPFEEAIVRAFQGGKEPGGYLATSEELGIQLKVFSGTTPDPPAQTLDAFCHTLTIVLIDRFLIESSDVGLWEWLAGCWKHADLSNGRHEMLAVPME